ncbi:MAG: 4-hydroxy-tetrahydrodipicolinate synthase [Thermodesulfovibrionales bacterium]|nr:4-hydroxy-tetrahydrodipicolinate synthase [Thermodesulfovibrionales bacterium]
MFQGSMVAVVTPFKGGRLDEKALSKLIEWHIKEGTDAIIPCGTTGESATLDYKEHYRVIEVTVKTVAGRVPVIAGTGANSTAEAIEITQKARKLGADGALLVSPYYNKPTQEGLYLHYKAIAASLKGFPLVLYNVPGRTAVNMLPSTVARLSEIKNIVGLKEATGDMKQASEILRLVGDRISILSGDDFTTFALYALGGKGSISVTANVAPRDMAGMWDAWAAGDIEKARKLHYKMEPLNSAMFIETNPIPVKTALSMMGKIKEEFRLPLCKMSDANRDKLKNALKGYGLI